MSARVGLAVRLRKIVAFAGIVRAFGNISDNGCKPEK